MKKTKIFAFIEPAMTGPLTFDPELCNGCDKCLEVCQMDIMISNPEKKKPPIVLYPGECWYDGSCVEVCPIPGAIKLNSLPQNSVHWKRKKTGEDFWL